MTELALVVPILVVIFMGVLDLGRAFHTEVAASNAARVGLIYAQQVASPRMLDCTPGTTCQFITVGDIIDKVKAEAQGGIDMSQAQVNVCLQHVSTCPVADTGEAVASNEAITISVSVPFNTITPFVHLSAVAGMVSGQTFPFEPVYPTPTPNSALPTPTPTSTVTPTPIPPGSTATPTVTPQPTPNITSGPNSAQWTTGNGKKNTTYNDTISWSTDQPFSGNSVWVALQGSTNFTQTSATDGTAASHIFTDTPGGNSGYTYLTPGTYKYYVESSSTGGTTFSPWCGGSCPSTTYPTFYLP